MGNTVQNTEEIRGMQPSSEQIIQQLNASKQQSDYVTNIMRDINNNFNLYKYNWATKQYNPDRVDYSRIPEDFGSSKYDYSAPDLETIYGGLDDWRAGRQGFASEVLASAGQFLTNVAGTTLQSLGLIPGVIAGGITHAIDYIQNDPLKPEEEKHNLIYDLIFNPISEGINKSQDYLIDNMPLYKTQEELNNSWWTNITHHPLTWLMADALPSVGFTVGAMVGGKISGEIVNAALNKVASQKKILDRAAELGLALENIPESEIPAYIQKLKAANAKDKLEILNKYLKGESVKNSIGNWAGILTASATEANVEGYQTRKEYIDSTLPRAYEYMKSDLFQSQLRDSFKNDPEGFVDFEDYRREKERAVIKSIVQTADKIGTSTWAANAVFLSAHNKFFWDSFFNPKYALRNSLRDYSKFYDIKTEDGLVKSISMKDDWFLKHPKTSKVLFSARQGVAEGWEEMEQARFSESSKALYGSRMNQLFFDDYKAILNPKYDNKGMSLMEAAGEGLKDTYLNSERWEEGLIGFLTGAIGLPRFGVHSGKYRTGKKGINGWDFGGSAEFESRKEQYKRAGEVLKQFRTEEQDNKEALESLRQYLSGNESEQLQKINIVGKSPLDMLRTTVLLNSITDSVQRNTNTSSDEETDMNVHNLLERRSKLMSGILSAYDSYVQLGISKYFDNWLNYLININKGQKSQKDLEFIDELANSGILSQSDTGSPIYKSYSEGQKEDMLNYISENAKQIKKLLNTYNKIESQAFDIFYNNFKGTSNSYAKIRSLLFGLTKAKFFEDFISREENQLPLLTTKADFYNLKGYKKLYDLLGSGKSKDIISAVKNLVTEYLDKLLSEGINVNNTDRLSRVFQQYVYDIMTADKLQEYVYSISTPDAYDKELDKAVNDAQKKHDDEIRKALVSNIKTTLLKSDKNASDDSAIVKSILEFGGNPKDFNKDRIKELPTDIDEIKSTFGITDNNKAKRLAGLIKEAKKYTDLIYSDIIGIKEKGLTEVEENAVNNIREFLRSGGEFSNVHDKFIALLDQYFSLHALIESSDKASEEELAAYKIYNELLGSDELRTYFNNHKIPQGVTKPYSFFAYEVKKQGGTQVSQNNNDFKKKVTDINDIYHSEVSKLGDRDIELQLKPDYKENKISIIAFNTNDPTESAVAVLGEDNKWDFNLGNLSNNDTKSKFTQFCEHILSLYEASTGLQNQNGAESRPESQPKPQITPETIQPDKTRDIAIYNGSNEIIPSISIADNYVEILKDIANGKETDAYQNIQHIVNDTSVARQILEFMKGLIKENPDKSDSKPFHIVLPDIITPTQLRYNVFKFGKGAVIKNTIIDNKLFDVEVSEVDNGKIINVQTIDDEPVERNGKRYKVSIYNELYKANEIIDTKPDKSGSGNSGLSSQFPITQVDHEYKGADNKKYKNEINVTTETDNSIKGTPLFKYIRDKVLSPSGAYSSMVKQTDGVYDHLVGDELFFDYIEFTDVENRSELENELAGYYKNYRNLQNKLIGIWSSDNVNTRKLLGVVDPMFSTNVLSKINNSKESISDVRGEIKKLVTGNSTVIIEANDKKNSVSDLDPDNECMYVVTDGVNYYTNMSKRQGGVITKERLCKLLGVDKIDLNSGVMYIFSPTRLVSNPDKRFTKAHVSTELLGMKSVSIENVPNTTVDGIREFAKALKENKLNTSEGDENSLHKVSNLFYSTIKNFNIKIRDNKLIAVTSTKSTDNKDNIDENVVEIDTSSEDSIVNGIVKAAYDADVTFKYDPKKLFINNNKWFNELKPYLATRKAFVGESNIYFKYDLKDNSGEQESIEGASSLTEPSEPIQLSQEDTKPSEQEKHPYLSDTLVNALETAKEGLSKNSTLVNNMINDIKSKGKFSKNTNEALKKALMSGTRMSTSEVVNKMKELQNIFQRELFIGKISNPCNGIQ